MSTWPRALDAVLARIRLARCTRVGARSRIDGTPFIICDGELTIGDDFELRSLPVQSHLVVGAGGRLRIGHRVHIGFGAAISCQGRVDIEDGVSLGSFCMIMDSDFHVAGAPAEAPELKPIRVGARARLGHRVIVLPGASVGEDAVVAAGSVVSGEVLAGAVVEGNPARARAALANSGDGALAATVPALVRVVLGLADLPRAGDGPEQIPQWDSLGALRLVLALEERFEVTLTEDEIRGARCVRDIEAAIDAARRRQASLVL